jgi:hypothetical protein
MMCPVIDNPTSCESHTVVHFLLAKNMSTVEIHLNYAQFSTKV